MIKISTLIFTAIIATSTNVAACPTSVDFVRMDFTHATAYLLTSNGRVDCSVIDTPVIAADYILECENGAKVWTDRPYPDTPLEDIAIQFVDRNGSHYRMNFSNKGRNTYCNGNQFRYEVIDGAYQQAFEFDVVFTLYFNYDKSDAPAGFN